MKKITLKILVVIFFQITASSQSCLPEGIIFYNQAQIDNFQSNNPGCTEIEGYVLIMGDDITNLLELSVLTSIGGELWISENDKLASLMGLENLTSIGGSLTIGKIGFAGNPYLTTLAGLNNLTSVGSYVKINNNPALISLTGLENLASVGGDMQISDNPSLTNLMGIGNLPAIGGSFRVSNNLVLPNMIGLNSLTSIEGGIIIEDNPSMTTLSGLDNLVSVEGTVRIDDNVGLVSLTGLESLTIIGDALSISNNEALTSFIGLDNLTSLGTYININNNNALTSLSGLDNIDADSITNLVITHNDILATCEVQSICYYLNNPVGYVVIQDNAQGCNSIEEVEEACLWIGISDIKFKSRIKIFPNPAGHEFIISLNDGKVVDEVSIYTLTGQKVLHASHEKNNINISHLEPGMYIVEATIEHVRIRQKLIVE